MLQERGDSARGAVVGLSGSWSFKPGTFREPLRGCISRCVGFAARPRFDAAASRFPHLQDLLVPMAPVITGMGSGWEARLCPAPKDQVSTGEVVLGPLQERQCPWLPTNNTAVK